MNDLRKELEGYLNGTTPIKRQNPKPGQSQWYYMVPQSDDEFSDFDIVDVESQFSPLPDSFRKKHLNQNNTPDIAVENNSGNYLRTAEQMSAAAMDGLSLGLSDEINGAMNAVGYGLASLVPSWNKRGESFSEAMKRGYAKGSNEMRQTLEQGLEENPKLVGSMQVVGAMASPVNHVNVFGKVPGLTQVGKALQRPTVSGTVAGAATAEGGIKDRLYGATIGYFNGMISNNMATPISRNLKYSPSGYGNGNLVHNLLQPAIYTINDKAKNNVTDTAEDYLKFNYKY